MKIVMKQVEEKEGVGGKGRKCRFGNIKVNYITLFDIINRRH